MTITDATGLEGIRALVRDGHWDDAVAAGDALPDTVRATPQALELAASAAYGAGDLETTLSAWEEVHAIHHRAGEPVLAAQAAAMVAMYLLMDTGLMAPVRGWLSRVDRLLADQDETAVHAMAATLRAYERFMSGDLPAAGRWGARAVDVGDRHHVGLASALGRVATARVIIFGGDVAGGLEILDEVAVMLMSGQVDALTTGMVYCELICAMQGLALYDRADEWTLAMEARRRGGDFFGGINGRCRIHRAELLRLKGACAEAEEEALHACDELRPWMRREFGWPLTELGTIRLRRGDHAGAGEAFRAAHARGWDPEPGPALLRLAEGDAGGAATLIRDALERPARTPWKERPPIGGITRVPLLEAAALILLAAGDTAGASATADELAMLADRYGSPALRAGADLAAGLAALGRAEAPAAVAACRAAIDGWCAVGAPYETAHARLALAEAFRLEGRVDLAEFETGAATTALNEIGAVALPIAGIAELPIAATGTDLVSPTVHTSASATAVATFRCDGDTREVTFDGRTVLFRDLKGMRHLARLLAEPGREFHALALVSAESGAVPPPSAVAEVGELSLSNDDAGPMIDDQARTVYRRRLLEIEEDIEEAEAMGDSSRAELGQRDRDFIVAELTRAFGIGGRPRAAGSSSERARTSVTRAVRYALARVAEQHPSLAEHLDATIVTGTYCAYRPDPRVPITWLM